MSKNFNNRVLALSQTIFGWLLRAYPPAHRAEYGPAMAQLFRDQGRDAWNEAQGWGMVKLWLRVLPDLASTVHFGTARRIKERKTMNDKLANLTLTGRRRRPISSEFLWWCFSMTLIVAMVDNLYPSGNLCQHRTHQSGIRSH